MPFRSERQRRFLWARHPKIAKKWSRYPFGLKQEPRARTVAMSDRITENLKERSKESS